MAVWATITKAFDNYTLYDGTYAKSANAEQGTSARISYYKVGQTNVYDGKGRAGIRLSGIGALLGTNGGVTNVRITCSSNVGGTSTYSSNLCALSADISAMSASQAWSTMTSSAGYVLGLAENGALLDITDAEQIARIIQNGMFLGEPNESGGMVYARYCWIYASTTVQILYYSAKTPAQTAILTPADLSNQIGSEDIEVTWSYAHEINTVAQYAYKVEISTDDGLTWTELADTVSSAHSYTIPADTIPDGPAKLRLTVYTQDPDTSTRIAAETQEVSFTVRSNPSTSDVACDGKPHPTVTWTGADQSAYQVRFADWDSGAIFGDETSLTIPHVYAAGVYPVTVRTQTSNGDWSEWSETLWAEITNTDRGLTTTLTCAQQGASMLCSWTAAAASGYILLRDGVPIWAGTETYHRDDYAVAGTAVYMVRALDADGDYTDSAPVTAQLRLRCDVLRPLDDAADGWTPIRYSLSARSRSYDRSIDTTFRHYAGREKPVAISAGASTRTMRTTAAFRSRAEAQAILALAGRPILYKDYNGDSIVGILNPAGYDSERVYSVDMSVTEIDHPDDLDAQIAAIYANAVRHIIDIDVDEETVYRALINSNNQWFSPGTTGKAWMLEVPDGTEKLRITTPSNKNQFAYLTTNTIATSGTPDFCASPNNTRFAAVEGENLLTIPADCKYVYVSVQYSGGDIVPTAARWEGTYVSGT